CDISTSQYQYRISNVANAFFIGLLCLSFCLFAATFLVTRKSRFTVAFLVAMELGLVAEIIEYVGRAMSWQNQWSQNPYLIQICCLTIGPAFLSAGIYVCLRRIVALLGEDASRIPPVWYTRIFIPCDVLSLILQATGGGMAASEARGFSGSVDTGNYIMIASLSLQVFTLLIFIVLAGDFLIRVYRKQRHLRPRSYGPTPSFLSLWGMTGFYGTLTSLAISTIYIFWRSVFRVAELSDGWTGSLMGRQDLFIGFEGVMISVTVMVLNLWHPALVLSRI
ncbi:RTA1 like protein, partial [Thozetella sp. PMI_491]